MRDVISSDEWRERSARHVDRLSAITTDRIDRMKRLEKHPVHDFLFEYYSFRPSLLLRWSPGTEVLLRDATRDDMPWKEFHAVPGGMILPAEEFPEHRVSYLHWAIDYLEGIAQRPPSFGCFGLHEWAMVYRESTVRHAQTPLRLSSSQIAALVEADGVRCTHYDAYRFFSPAAIPLNRLELKRAITNQHDQRGCVHVTMDLYRLAYKIAPWCEGETLADAFLLACKARQLDMRASPYDLRQWGLDAIPIETREGRETYVEVQRELTRSGEPIRARLIDQYRKLLGYREKVDNTQ